jgi:hypothetical protein
MAKPCSVCTDPRRAEIDKSLESLPRHQVSRTYKIPKHRIDNHAQNHGKKRTSRARDAESSEIAVLKAQAQDILDSTKDEKVQLAALQRLQQLHELELRLHGDKPTEGALASDPAFQKLAVALDRGLCAKCVNALDALLEGLLSGAVAEVAKAPTLGDTPPE